MFWRTESKSTKKSCRFKTWMEFVRQILMKLKTSSNEGLLLKVFSHSLMWLSKHCSGHIVTTQACTLISRGCVHLRWCGSLEDDTLWGTNAATNIIHDWSQFRLMSGTEHYHIMHLKGFRLPSLQNMWIHHIREYRHKCHYMTSKSSIAICVWYPRIFLKM